MTGRKAIKILDTMDRVEGQRSDQEVGKAPSAQMRTKILVKRLIMEYSKAEP